MNDKEIYKNKIRPIIKENLVRELYKREKDMSDEEINLTVGEMMEEVDEIPLEKLSLCFDSSNQNEMVIANSELKEVLKNASCSLFKWLILKKLYEEIEKINVNEYMNIDSYIRDVMTTIRYCYLSEDNFERDEERKIVKVKKVHKSI